MKFGWMKLALAEGAHSAHSLRCETFSIKKGERVTAAHVTALAHAGIEEILAFRLEPGDVGEDAAAQRLAAALAGPHVQCAPPHAGRVNLHAMQAGLAWIDAARIDAVNAVDEGIGVATLPPWRAVSVGALIATVKIIPYSMPEVALAAAIAQTEAIMTEGIIAEAAISIAPYQPRTIAMIVTVTEQTQGGAGRDIFDKTRRALTARLRPSGAILEHEERVSHEIRALTAAIQRAAAASDALVIFGAAATSDRCDTVPAAIEAAGGRIEHFGMPVDPGNLLLLAAHHDNTPIISAPGCARSIKENGFDFILRRMLCGIPTRSADIRKMGVGGLLNEILIRPQPRDAKRAAQKDETQS